MMIEMKVENFDVDFADIVYKQVKVLALPTSSMVFKDKKHACLLA